MWRYQGLRGYHRGFLLVEVMVGAVVLSTSLVFILAGFRQILRLVKTIEEITPCAWLAEARLWDIEARQAQGLPLEGETDKGEFLGSGGYTWDFSSQPFLEPGLTQLTLRVYRPSKAQGVSVTCLLKARE
jgi:type II secretory pathway pseudopilin PulG